MQRHPQAWKGMCCSETSWKAQNLRRTQTAATVEGVTQTAKQDFKLYSQTIYPGKVSPNLEKKWNNYGSSSDVKLLLSQWSVQYHTWTMYSIIALSFITQIPASARFPHIANVFFLFFSNKIQVSLICSLIRRLSRYSQHADADGAPTYSLKRSINFKWLPYISLIALVSSHISIWGPAGGLVRCAIIKVQSYIGVK